MKKLLVKSLALINLTAGIMVASIQPSMADVRFVTGRDGHVPPGAVQGGFDGEDLYVCTVGIAIGKLAPSHGKCYVAYGGREHGYNKYQVVVVDRYQWVPLTGDVPQGAVVAGRDGEPLYVCSAIVAGKLTPGKYAVSHDVCHVPYGGKEIGVRNFKVLVSR